MDFQDVEARTVAERRREKERQRKMERIYKERVEAASKDMEGKHYNKQNNDTKTCCQCLLSVTYYFFVRVIPGN